MSLQKAKIEGAIYDVISYDEYYKNPELYESYGAIRDGAYIYPIRKKTDIRPGFYPNGCIDFFKQPSAEECQMYSVNNIIDFENATNLKDIIDSQQRLMSEERSILTTIDNVFQPDIADTDTPEMKALKQAIIDKHIDLDKYEPRFGPNYNNDKRLLKKGSITFGKLRSICNALDIKATITIEDAGNDVPNPIGKVISADITSDNAEEEE